MIITDSVGATAIVDGIYADDEAAVAATRKQLQRAVIREGEEIGAFIRKESVWITRHPSAETGSTRFDGHWFPDPAEGCEFQGGSADGATLRLTRTESGAPPLIFTVAAEPTKNHVFDDAGEPSLSQTTDYVRTGINSATDRWVYSARPR